MSLRHRAARTGQAIWRKLESVFGDITWTSVALVLAAGFVAMFLGIVSGLIGGIVALLFVLFVLFVIIAIRDYRTGALIAVVFLPLSATRLVPRELLGIKGMNPLNVVLVMSITSLILGIAFSQQRIILPKLPKPYKIFIAALILCGLHGALSVHLIPPRYKILDLVAFDTPIGYVRDVMLKPLIILMTGYLLAVAVANAKSTRRYLIPLFSGAVLLALVVIGYIAISGVSLSVLSSSHSRNFLSALGAHANELGFMFNMAFALALFCFFYIETLIGRLSLLAVLGILTIGIGLSFSRGAFLGYIMIIAYFLFTQRKFQMMAGVLCAMVVLIPFMPQAIVDRATTGVKQGDVKEVSAGRVDEIWRPLLPETLKSPLIGRGLSSVLWSDATRANRIPPVGHPHSAYLGMILDFGFGGALIIFYFYHHMWTYFRRLGKEHEESLWRGFFQAAQVCILLVAVQGLSDDRVTPTLPQSFLWLAYGLALGIRARTDQVAPPPAEKFKRTVRMQRAPRSGHRLPSLN